MAVDPYTMMMIAQGVGKMAQSGSRLLQPKFQNTKYGRLLRQTKHRGNLSQGQENTILNRVGTQAGAQANVSKGQYLGRMYNQGMEGSVALNRAMREADQDVRRQVTDTAKGIYLDEERAKRDAKIAYAQGMDQDKAQRRQAWVDVAGVGAEMAMQHYGKKYQDAQKATDSADKSYRDAVAKYGPEGVQNMYTPSGKEFYTGKEGALPRQLTDEFEKYKQQKGIDSKVTINKVMDVLTTDNLSYDQMKSRLKQQGLNDADIDEWILKMAEMIAGGK